MITLISWVYKRYILHACIHDRKMVKWHGDSQSTNICTLCVIVIKSKDTYCNVNNSLENISFDNCISIPFQIKIRQHTTWREGKTTHVYERPIIKNKIHLRTQNYQRLIAHIVFHTHRTFINEWLYNLLIVNPKTYTRSKLTSQ